jgi:predicted nucleic acid-binding protein
MHAISLARLYRCVKRTYIFPLVILWEKSMSIYFIPLFTLPNIIDAPGEYLTRGGDRVMIDRASTRHDYGCVGSYVGCGTAEKWHKSGRILATSQTRNDVVCKASCEAAPAYAATIIAAEVTNVVQVPQATWAQKIKAIRKAAEGVGKRAIREVNRNLAEGVEHMEFKDFQEFDCASEDEYIFGEAVHLIEELNLPFDDALKVVLAEDSQTA